jgi:signal transduction histidine kinase
MPGLDGYGALLRMRAEPVLRTTPVLMVTGATSGEDAAVCLRDGAHDFVRKPFDEVELLARVRAAYRHKAFEDELRQRNQELEAFSSAAAHDLKEPLAGIARLVDLLQGLHLDAGARMSIQDDIGLLAEEGSRLVTDLLVLAKEDWAMAALAHQVDVEAVVESVLEEARLTDAKVSVEGSWAKFLVPEIVLHSCVANLVSNADHYGRGADGCLDLSIASEVGREKLEITMADQGQGIHPSVVEHLFEPFVAGPDSTERNPLASGLGLAVTARALERYGGQLELLPSATGTTFRITLPLPNG